MTTGAWWLLFSLSFVVMEFNAWWLHKFVMHGPLWVLHEDHHRPRLGRSFQRNDLFALFFAVPSFLFILFDSLFEKPGLGAVGFGVMAYGAVYFFTHEVVIHRRWNFFSSRQNWYFDALNAAHKIHHSNRDKFGCKNFGMLVVPLVYFRQALQRSWLKSDPKRSPGR